MLNIKTNLITEAVFSDDNSKCYIFKKTWDDKKPSLTIIMLAPSEASGICLDLTTQLVLNNADRLGYGSVEMLNLFATLSHSMTEYDDKENIDIIIASAKEADKIVYAPGVGKSKNKAFQERQKQTLLALAQFQEKLFCLCDKNGLARLQHPLSPAVRVWHLSSLKIEELLSKEDLPEDKQKKETQKSKKTK